MDAPPTPDLEVDELVSAGLSVRVVLSPRAHVLLLGLVALAAGGSGVARLVLTSLPG